MILAIDPGLATLGWAAVEPFTARVVDVGVLTTKPDDKLGKNADRVRRTSYIAGELWERAMQYDVKYFAAESMSFPPHARGFGMTNAVASLCLSWGVVAGLAYSFRAQLFEVPPKTWQHAIVPGVKTIDYGELAAKVATYVEGQASAAKLLALPKSERTHALDAVGVGVFAALRRIPKPEGAAA